MRFYRNINLEVFKEIPKGACEVDYHGYVKNIHEIVKDPNVNIKNQYYYCPECEGYIEGPPSIQKIDNLGPLSGRRGVEYRCRRCWYQFAFSGCIS